MPAAVAPRAEDVVEGHPRLVEDARRHRPAEEREEKRLKRHEVRREVEHA